MFYYEIYCRTEFYYRRIHILLTDFIELMHSKVSLSLFIVY